jgi:hypothetical protein
MPMSMNMIVSWDWHRAVRSMDDSVLEDAAFRLRTDDTQNGRSIFPRRLGNSTTRPHAIIWHKLHSHNAPRQACVSAVTEGPIHNRYGPLCQNRSAWLLDRMLGRSHSRRGTPSGRPSPCLATTPRELWQLSCKSQNENVRNSPMFKSLSWAPCRSTTCNARVHAVWRGVSWLYLYVLKSAAAFLDVRINGVCHARVYVCVCVCVWERERERRGREIPPRPLKLHLRISTTHWVQHKSSSLPEHCLAGDIFFILIYSWIPLACFACPITDMPSLFCPNRLTGPCSGSPLCSRGCWFESQPRCQLSWFSSASPVKFQSSISIKSRPCPSKSFSVHLQ